MLNSLLLSKEKSYGYLPSFSVESVFFSNSLFNHTMVVTKELIQNKVLRNEHIYAI